jgi:hypothetical protein
VSELAYFSPILCIAIDVQGCADILGYPTQKIAQALKRADLEISNIFG